MFNLFGGNSHADSLTAGFGRGPPPGRLDDNDAEAEGKGGWSFPAGSSSASTAAPEAFSFSETAPQSGDVMAGSFDRSRESSPGKQHGEKKVKKHKRRTSEPPEAFSASPATDPGMNGSGYAPPMHVEHASPMAGGIQAPDMTYAMASSTGDQAGMSDWTGGYERSLPSEGGQDSELSPGSIHSERRRRSRRTSRRPPHDPGDTPPQAEMISSSYVQSGGASMTEAPFAYGPSSPGPPYTPGSGQVFMPDLQWAYSNPDRGQQLGIVTTPPDQQVSSRGIGSSNWSTPASAGAMKGALHSEVPLSWSTPQVRDGLGAAQQKESQQGQIDEALQAIWGPAMPSHPSEMQVAHDPKSEPTGLAMVRDEALQAIWGPAMPSYPSEMPAVGNPRAESTSLPSVQPRLATTPGKFVQSQQAGSLDLEWAQTYVSTMSNSHSEKSKELDLSWAKPAPSLPSSNATALEDPLIRTVFASAQPPSSQSQHSVVLGSASVDGGDELVKKDRVIEQLQDEFKKLRDRQKDDLIKDLQDEMRKKEQQHKEAISKLQGDLRLKEHENAALAEKLQGEINIREQKNESLIEHLQSSIKEREASHVLKVEQLQAEIKRLQDGQKDALVAHLQEEVNKLKDEVLAPRPSTEVVMGTVLEPTGHTTQPALGFVAGNSQSNNSNFNSTWNFAPTNNSTDIDQSPTFGQITKGPATGSSQNTESNFNSTVASQQPFPDGPAWNSMPVSNPQSDDGTLASQQQFPDGPAWNSMPVNNLPSNAAGATQQQFPAGAAWNSTPVSNSKSDNSNFNSTAASQQQFPAGPAWNSMPVSNPQSDGGNVSSSEAPQQQFPAGPAWNSMPTSTSVDAAQPSKVAHSRSQAFKKYPSFGPEDDISFCTDPPWMIDRESFERYRQAFCAADRNSDGYVEAAEAREVLDKTSLPPGDLALIWSLSDADQDGRLAYGEFLCAMHLAHRCTQRQEGVPLSLAEMETLASEFEKLGSAPEAPKAAQGIQRDPVVEDVGSLMQDKGSVQEPVPPTTGGHSNSRPPPLPPPPLPPEETSPWAVTPEEAERYGAIFASEADLHGTGFAGPMEAKQVLEQSNLPVPDLSIIWQVSDMDMDGQLDLLEFTCAMALVARRMQGAPLPSGAPPPELLSSLAAAGLRSKQAAGEAALSEQSQPGSPMSQPSDRGVQGSWVPTPEELERYQVVFESLCGAAVGGSGVLGADEGRELFERSGLSLDELSHIWRISDADIDGQLAPAEFVCAMTLVARRRQGSPLPPELPPELAQHLRVP